MTIEKQMIFAEDAAGYMSNLRDKSVGAVITSPPYNIGVKYDVVSDNRSDYLDWSMRWIREAVRISRGGVVINIGAKASNRNQIYRLLAAIASDFVIQNEIVWAKSVSVCGKTYGHFKPINSDKYVNNTHELIIHVVEQPIPVRKLAVGVPFEDKSNINRFAGNAGDLRCRGSIWYVPYETRTSKLKHPASYPVALAEMMIRYTGASSVHDPFAGSGTTGVACKKLGVNFTGTDISPAYCDYANARISKTQAEAGNEDQRT